MVPRGDRPEGALSGHEQGDLPHRDVCLRGQQSPVGTCVAAEAARAGGGGWSCPQAGFAPSRVARLQPAAPPSRREVFRLSWPWGQSLASKKTCDPGVTLAGRGRLWWAVPQQGGLLVGPGQRPSTGLFRERQAEAECPRLQCRHRRTQEATAVTEPTRHPCGLLLWGPGPERGSESLETARPAAGDHCLTTTPRAPHDPVLKMAIIY